MSTELDNILRFEPVEGNDWDAVKLEKTVKDGMKFLKKVGSNLIYKEKGDGYECLNCGSVIMSAQVAHPIWDGPFPMSGSGKCHYESVPYCPKCEERPNFHGMPITP